MYAIKSPTALFAASPRACQLRRGTAHGTKRAGDARQRQKFCPFQQDDANCRQFASAPTGGTSPAEAANTSTATSTVVGTVLGAAAGAAIGAATGNPAAGAAIGAGSGLFFGGVSGVNAGAYSAASLQQLYDMRYVQCMAANGNQVPQPTQLGAGYPGYYSPYAYAYPYPYAYRGYYPYYPWF